VVETVSVNVALVEEGVETDGLVDVTASVPRSHFRARRS
jgi:hypothetical protein